MIISWYHYWWGPWSLIVASVQVLLRKQLWIYWPLVWAQAVPFEFYLSWLTPEALPRFLLFETLCSVSGEMFFLFLRGVRRESFTASLFCILYTLILVFLVFHLPLLTSLLPLYRHTSCFSPWILEFKWPSGSMMRFEDWWHLVTGYVSVFLVM